jgi:hypothetical protein
MACGNIYDAFRVATEHLGKELYRRASFNSIWGNLLNKGEFPKHVGLTKSVFEIGNAYPDTDERTWDAYTLATGSNTGACAYNFTDYTVGYDELTYTPSHFQLRGPLFCKDDLNFDHMADQFLNGYVEELTKLVDIELSNKFRLEYTSQVPKAVMTAAFPITAAGAGLTALPEATSDLTQEALDKAYVHLIHKRASNPDSNGWISFSDGGPLFTLYLGMEASQAIILNNSEFRKDLREGSMNLELFRRLAANTAIKGFRHVINPLPARYTFSGGTYTRVNTFVDVAGSKGTYQDINPAYLDEASAPFEACEVLSPDVVSWDWVRPDNQVGRTTWEPQSYMGDWKFITGPEACAADGSGYDPFHKNGRHIAEMAGAAKPGSNRSAGLMILFKRCHLSSLTTVTCT